MLQLETKTYLVYQEPGGKAILARYDGDAKNLTSDSVISVTCEKGLPDNPADAEVKVKHIVAVLGTKPKTGRAYGCLIEPYLSTQQTNFGPIHFYRRMPKEEKALLLSAIEKECKSIVKQGWGAIFPITWHIRPKTGRYAGKYQYRGGDGKDILTLCLESMEVPASYFAGKESSWVAYVIRHELAHGLHYNLFTPKHNRQWLRSWHSNNILTIPKAEDIKEARLALLACADFDALKALRESSENAALVLSWIADYHGVKVREFSEFLGVDTKFLKSLMPTVELLKPDRMEPLGSYAATNHHEFFAECFALNSIGHSMPEGIIKLLSKTLQDIKK